MTGASSSGLQFQVRRPLVAASRRLLLRETGSPTFGIRPHNKGTPAGLSHAQPTSRNFPVRKGTADAERAAELFHGVSKGVVFLHFRHRLLLPGDVRSKKLGTQGQQMLVFLTVNWAAELSIVHQSAISTAFEQERPSATLAAMVRTTDQGCIIVSAICLEINRTIHLSYPFNYFGIVNFFL